MARRGLPPREAHHLRGRRGSHPVRPQTIPQHPDPLNKQTNHLRLIFLRRKFSNALHPYLFLLLSIRVKFILYLASRQSSILIYFLMPTIETNIFLYKQILFGVYSYFKVSSFESTVILFYVKVQI